MTVNNYGLYAVITPGPGEREWNFHIYRDSYGQSAIEEDRIWKQTGVKTYGTHYATRFRAENRARKRIAKIVHAYDMLARQESTVV
jgi:hypothetical protein